MLYQKRKYFSIIFRKFKEPTVFTISSLNSTNYNLFYLLQFHSYFWIFSYLLQSPQRNGNIINVNKKTIYAVFLIGCIIPNIAKIKLNTITKASIVANTSY